MKFNLDNEEDRKSATAMLFQLKTKHALIELKEISPSRTYSQNNYLHLIIAAFGQHFGYTAAEAKMIYKEINKELYFYKKKNRTFVKSSADLSKKEMAKTIDAFMKKSAEAGYPLPLATDKDWLLQLEQEIERSKHYL